MSSMAPVNLNSAPPAAVPSIILPLEHFGSSDHFQQILSIDSALEALSMSEANLALKLQALAVSQGLRSPGPIDLYDGADPEDILSDLDYAYSREDFDGRVLPEYDAIQQGFSDLDTIVRAFKEIQAAARHRHELQARSLRQGKITGIMDLPNEVLRMIFDNFRRPLQHPECPTWPDRERDISPIRNLRLTHPRFRDCASHLVARRLYLSLTDSGLKRLEGVSRHLEISQGVRVLHVDLRYYSVALARDLQAFSAMCYKTLRDRTRAFERIFLRAEENEERLKKKKEEREELGLLSLSEIEEESEEESEEKSEEESEEESEEWSDEKGDKHWHLWSLQGISLESARNSVATIQRTLSSWEPFMNGAPLLESDHLDAAASALRRGHERYRELFRQQERLLQDGHFARSIATIAAAGESKVWLYMTDNHNNPWDKCFNEEENLYDDFEKSDLEIIADPNELVQSVMVQPQQWWCAEGVTAAEIPQSLLYEIPLAMGAAQANLARFDVDISYPSRLNLDMSNDQVSGFMDVTKGIESFSFRMEQHFATVDNEAPPPEPMGLEGFYAYLCAAMDPRNVPDLSLSLSPMTFRDGNQEWTFRFPIKPLLRSLNWHGLDRIKLRGFEIDIQDMRKLTGMLKSGQEGLSRTSIDLENIHLTSGTWAAALDCLRSKAGTCSSLLSPSGAECERMTDVEYCGVFSDVLSVDFFNSPTCDPLGSKATQYINSVDGVKHPLLKDDVAIEVD